jgi:hypothetical protein
MLKKKITASSDEVKEIKIKTGSSFSKGFKFFMSGHFWTVLAEEGDASAPMRRIVAENGSQDVVLLSSLKNDEKTSSDFKVL